MMRPNRWLETVTFAVLCLVCMGFEWPGRVVRLSQQLRSEDVAERREAARLLGEHQAQDARAALLVALDDDDPGVRHEAIASAAKIGLREHVPVLIDWLNDPAADTRVAAAQALGALREPRAEAPLIRALGDGDARVRTVAATALGQVGGVESVTPLLGRLDDPDPGARLAAVKSLGMLADPRALVPLMSRTQDAAIEVKVAALTVLGGLGDPRALVALVRSLDDDAEEARMAAVAALGQLAQPAALEPLRTRLQSADGRLGRAVLAALGSIGTEAAVRLIVEQLGKSELSRGAVDVLVERVRRVRRLDPPAASAVIELLAQSLVADVDGARATAIEDALVGCSRLTSIKAALPALLSAFQAQRGTLPMTALALASTHDESALSPLLERLDGAQADDQLALLRALDVLTLKIERDGRAADPLLTALTHAQPEAIALSARLLGRTGAARALPALSELLSHARKEVQLAAIEALGTIGAAESTPQLLTLINDPRSQLREAAANALGKTLSAAQVIEQLNQLAQLTDSERLTRLQLIATAIARLQQTAALTESHRATLSTALTTLIGDEDEALASYAIDALSALKTPENATAIAALLRSPHPSLRAHAARALGAFDTPQVRHVLRFVITHDHVEVAIAAATALGRIGEAEDAHSLAKLSKRFHWPFPAAASYAIALIARRGLLKPLASHGLLCELGQSREPIVRANVAVAMAELGVGACDNGPDPIQWLRPEHASLVRIAAARWVFAAVNAGRLDRATGLGALSNCAARDAEPRVADACAAPEMPALSATIHQVVTDPEGRKRLRHRLLALELADASVYVGHTDDNGQLHVGSAPSEHAIVTDPGLLPLEPAIAQVPSPDAASRPATLAPSPP